MRDFPSCSGENSVKVGDFTSSTSGGGGGGGGSSSRASQNLVSCVYMCRLRRHSCLITLTWTKNLIGHELSLSIDDASNQCICKVDIKPGLFSKRKGLKSVDLGGSSGIGIDVYWDLSCAKFGSSPQPVEGFYVGVLFNNELILLLGDMEKEACKRMNISLAKSKSVFIAKREHIFGKRSFATKAQFCDRGSTHDVLIECGNIGVADSCLVVRIDSKTVMKVKHLQWKFRGNQTILVDGLPVEVNWDVHNWLYGNALGSAVFMFQTCLSAEKMWDTQAFTDASLPSWNCSNQPRDSGSQGLGFSLVLYAWKNE